MFGQTLGCVRRFICSQRSTPSFLGHQESTLAKKNPCRKGGPGALRKASSCVQGWSPGCWTVLLTSFLPILSCLSLCLCSLPMQE